MVARGCKGFQGVERGAKGLQEGARGCKRVQGGEGVLGWGLVLVWSVIGFTLGKVEIFW